MLKHLIARGDVTKRLLSAGLVLCLMVGMIFAAGESEQPKTAPMIAEEEPVQKDFTWEAKWIWGDFEENDSWLLARKTFTLESVPKEPVWADVSCDSKYWLYINGEPVVRDGCLKRGRTPESTYYDSVDVSSFLKEGENSIDVLVWYWGVNGALCYHSSGQGGLLFQMDAGDNRIVSDDSWMVCRDEAFSNQYDKSNYRLPETDIYYMAEKEPDDRWETAKILGEAGDTPWGELIRRDIPMFLDSDETEYVNDAEMPWKADGSYETVLNEKFQMQLPYNAQIYPMLSVEAEAGKEIKITSDMREHVTGDSVMTTYVTKDGVQSFETPGWMNGEVITYEIPAGVKILSLTYRETGYDTSISGSFACEDEFYNTLYEKSARSVYLNMRDTYMDCPNRERVCWAGDMALDMMVSAYSMDPSALELYASSLRTVLGNSWNGVLWTVNPTETWTELPCQMLMLIPTVYDYYLFTGDMTLVEDAYEPFCTYLNFWAKNEDGLYGNTMNVPYFSWGDSTENVDYGPVENAWLCGAFDAAEKMAVLLEKEEDAKAYEEKKKDLIQAYQRAYWTDEGYKSKEAETPDERANAAAVIVGIATAEQYDTIAKVFETTFYSTPFLEYYVERACCEMDRPDIAQMRIKKRYKDMVNGVDEKNTTTLWEHFRYGEGTSNHGWAAGPLVIETRYFTGVSPTEGGYQSYIIKPNMGELKEVKTSVETIHGTIDVEVSRSNNELRINVTQPGDITARIAVEKISDNPKVYINGKKVFKNGKNKDISKKNYSVTYVSEDKEYIYFDVTGEEISVESK